MRPNRGSVWGCALVVLAAASGETRAAWDNVFQTCCWGCNKHSTAQYPPVAAEPAAASALQPNCTTRYVQRSYYQPVTTYKTETYYEPVTTYRTSYYYEPVTTVRYSCSYDPCTGCPQQVATPTTSYRLRSQCCPVTSYMQRTACKPVTSYQMAYYYEPQTTCCQTTIGAPIYGQPPAAGPAPAGPPPSVPAGPPPSVSDGYGSGPPRVEDNSGGLPPKVTDSSRKFYEPPLMPRAEPNSYRQPQLGAPSTAPVEPAKVRLDKIVSLPRTNVEGEVRGARGLRVLFVSADRARTQEEVITDEAGSFRVTLAAGNWLVYTHGADGRPVYHRKLEVRDDEPSRLTLAAR